MQIKTASTSNLLETTNSLAIFSDCFAYRYYLQRQWEVSLPSLTFVMLNPSTADQLCNDPTIARCERRAREAGDGELRILNLFALRSTDPARLRTHTAPTGTDNDAIIQAYTQDTTIICAWGTDGELYGRGKQVEKALRSAGKTLYYLKLNEHGSPAHPLYLSYKLEPRIWQTHATMAAT